MSVMKPTLKISTPNNTDAFFTSGYEKNRSPIPLAHDKSEPGTIETGLLESGYPFPPERTRWRGVTSWLTGKGRGGIGRKTVIVVLFGLIWLSILVRQQPWFTQSRARYAGRILPGPSTYPRKIDLASDAMPLDATLRERLDVWRHAPGGRGDIPGEVEPGEFMQWNLEQCGSTIDRNLNTHMIQHSHHLWASQTKQSIHEHRMELIDHMEEMLGRNMTEQYGSGRGIVMVAGNADTLQRVRWSLEMIRSYGSKLPVQIYHFPSEAPAPDASIRTELSELGAELVEASGQERDEGKSKSYHIKAISITDSPWREVIYLDSDSIPLDDPSLLFDAPSYRRLGMWATPDYWKTPSNNPMWAIMGVKCRNEWEMESGQMVIDKQRHLDVMLLVRYMMEHHDFWFRFSDGDKDIFRFALLALRKRWAVPGRWVAPAGFPRRTVSGDFCGHTMLQHDAYGEPMFVHYNLLKQIPSGVGKGFSWGRSKQFPMFNEFPASPATARLGGSTMDDGRSGLGDVDCDMLADADEQGFARAQAPEEVMRRAARERGVKVVYHGGVTSALCINLEYMDPRPKDRQKQDSESFAAEDEQRIAREQSWQSSVDKAKTAGMARPVSPEEMSAGPVHPDWSQSPIELVHWQDHSRLKDFEHKIYGLGGFKPNGKGF